MRTRTACGSAVAEGVDGDLTGLDPPGRPYRSSHVPRPDGRGQSVAGAIGDRDGLLHPALGMLTASQVVPRLHDRVGFRRLMVAGGAGAALVIGFLALLTAVPRALTLYPSMYLLGASVGLLFASAGTLTASLAGPSGTDSAFADRTAFLTLADLCLCAALLALRVSDRRIREGYGAVSCR